VTTLEKSDAPIVLQATSLAKSFATAAGAVNVLRDASLSLRRSECAAITGPSGSGKSTFLYLVGLLDEPTSGTVEIDGTPASTLRTGDRADFRNRRIGFVFQDHHLLPQCTVIENVLIPTLVHRNESARERGLSLLERVGLKERVDHLPAQLSGGERQRVAVCRAMINTPGLLLADEPTGNLDRRTADVVGSLLLEMAAEEQTALVCVTHSTELADRFPIRYELEDGTLVAR